MVETEHHGQYEDLEESDEGVWCRDPAEDEGEEGGETSIEDRRANLLQAGESSL